MPVGARPGCPAAAVRGAVDEPVGEEVQPGRRPDLHEPDREVRGGCGTEDLEQPAEQRGRPTDLVGLGRGGQTAPHLVGVLLQDRAELRSGRLGIIVAADARVVRSEARGAPRQDQSVDGRHHPQRQR
nr:hypothetical protein [Ornithinimicrobium cavernae]